MNRRSFPTHARGAWGLAATLAAVAGCDDGVATVAREAADRQAAQNAEMARVTHEAAQATRLLVGADAHARRELVAAQRELAAQRLQVAEGFDRLESERRAAATLRSSRADLAHRTEQLAALLAAVLALALAGMLLRGAAEEPPDRAVVDLLVEGAAAESERRFPLPKGPADLALPQPEGRPPG